VNVCVVPELMNVNVVVWFPTSTTVGVVKLMNRVEAACKPTGKLYGASVTIGARMVPPELSGRIGQACVDV